MNRILGRPAAAANQIIQRDNADLLVLAIDSQTYGLPMDWIIFVECFLHASMLNTKTTFDAQNSRCF